MIHSGKSHQSNPILGAGYLTAGIAIALLIGVTMAVVGTTPANAKPEFAAQTGLPCGQCHQNPAGGGKLKTFGEKFKANGNKVPK